MELSTIIFGFSLTLFVCSADPIRTTTLCSLSPFPRFISYFTWQIDVTSTESIHFKVVVESSL